MSDELNQMRARRNPALVQARIVDMQMMQALRGATGQGDVSRPVSRHYSDCSMSAALKIVTIIPRESGMLSLYGVDAFAGDPGFDDYILPPSITLDFATGTSGKKHAIYAYIDPIATATILDNPKIAAEFEAWTDETTRATTLDNVEGVLLKSSDYSRRWIGDALYDGTYVYIQGGIDQLSGRWLGTGDPNNMSGGTTTGYGYQVPGVLIGTKRYNSFTIKNDRLQVGFNTDGELAAGGGAVILNEVGESISLGDSIFFANYGIIGSSQVGATPTPVLEIGNYNQNASNLMTNGGFETGDFTGWTIDAGSPVVISSDFYGGAYCASLPNGAQINQIVAGYAGLDAEFYFWHKGPQVTISFQLLDAGSIQVFARTIPFAASAFWVRCSASIANDSATVTQAKVTLISAGDGCLLDSCNMLGTDYAGFSIGDANGAAKNSIRARVHKLIVGNGSASARPELFDVRGTGYFSGALTLGVPLTPSSGGTGISSAYTIGDLLVASSSTALSVLSDVAVGQALLSGGIGALPAYAGYTFAGTAAKMYTFPVNSATLPGLGELNVFSVLNTFTNLKLSTGKIYPSSDSTTALQITKADAATAVINIDTTNGRVKLGIGTSPTTQGIYIKDGGNTPNAGWVVGQHADDDNVFLAGFFNDTFSTAIPVFEYYGLNSGPFSLGTPSATSFSLYTNGYTNPRITIISSGAVGIGTVGPTETLSVSGSTGLGLKGTTPLSFGNTGGGYIQIADSTTTDGDLVFKLYQSTAYREQFRINNAGGVKINGSINAVQLNVVGFTTQTTATAIAQITRNDTAAGISAMLGLTALGSGANGDGGKILFSGKDSTTPASLMGFMDWRYISSTHASYTTAGRLYSTDASGDRLAIEIQSNGSAALLGVLGAPPVLQQAASVDLGTVLSNFGFRTAGAAYPVTTTGAVSFGRIYSTGTAIAVTDVALGAGWGVNAVVSAVTGNDSHGTITVTTSALDTPLAAPTLTMTFKDGTWTTIPYAVVNINDGSTGTLAAASSHCTATTLVMSYDGTPTALLARTYIFNYIVIG